MIKKKNIGGISRIGRMCIGSVLAFVAIYMLQYSRDFSGVTNLPFVDHQVDLGQFYIPFCIFVVVGSSNAVNLTDGLDSLATLITISVLIAFMCILGVCDLDMEKRDLVIVCSALLGSCLGFLWFNAFPARMFMGDAGSLMLGSVLGMISVVMRHEFIYAIIGGIFVIETFSVMAQLSFIKITKKLFGNKKKLFLKSPIHHHFEELGWSEVTIVMRFLIISSVFCVIGVSSVMYKMKVG